MFGVTAWVFGSALGALLPSPGAEAEASLRAGPPLTWVRPSEAVVPLEGLGGPCDDADPDTRRRQIAWSLAAGMGAFVVGISWGRWLEGVPSAPPDEVAPEEDEPEPPVV